MNIEKRKCAVRVCGVEIPDGAFMCPKHWGMVSRPTREEVKTAPSRQSDHETFVVALARAIDEVAKYEAGFVITKPKVRAHFREQAEQLKESLREAHVDGEGGGYEVIISVTRRAILNGKLWKHVTFKRADGQEYTVDDAQRIAKMFYDEWQLPLVEFQPGARVREACSLWAPAEQEVLLQ